ncbi:nucleoside-diphosphate sugar epimerase/dehydratase, partial [Pontiella sp.]|uniref:nucleoside-diphosphate sugar epimerase/dehydratase n=1 Tax=Pontiella sp. TaxID=2837462 RepID=UPI0035626C34
FATYFVFGVVLGRPFSLLHLAVCVVIPFATIFFYNIYKTVWTRSRISQLLVLFLQLVAGEALAYVALLWVSDLTGIELVIGLVLHSGVSAIGIVGARAMLRVARDLNAWLRCSVSNENDLKTLILGAGENAILYLRQATFEDQQKAPRKIVGLIDDNPALHQKSVFGFPVLGNFSELEQVVKEQGINELIFTHYYSDDLRAEILDLKSKYDLLVRDFIFVLRDLDETGQSNGILKPYSVTETDPTKTVSINPEKAEAAPMEQPVPACE